MAYEFVYESEAKRYRSDCTNVLKETCELLKEKGISAQFSLVGSGARNMITRNGDGPYDLDYNLLVMKADNEYRDPRLLKDTIRNALNKAVGGKFFSDAQDSTSCLTAILYFEKSPDIKFKFDVAITTVFVKRKCEQKGPRKVSTFSTRFHVVSKVFPKYQMLTF